MSETPGVAENRPEGAGNPSIEDRTAPGVAPPPDTNQGKTEPMPASADIRDRAPTVGSADPQSPSLPPGDAHRQPGNAGAGPSAAFADDDGLGAARTQPGSPPDSVPASLDRGVPSPGNVPGEAGAPAVQAAQGTSEESEAVTGIRATGWSATAVPGTPDGEVDTRG